MKNRKQPPEWDSPAELYDRMLSPNWKFTAGRPGVGAAPPQPFNSSEGFMGLSEGLMKRAFVEPALRDVLDFEIGAPNFRKHLLG
eukprot:3200019-Heterocapsa_arctica.AAC.1